MRVPLHSFALSSYTLKRSIVNSLLQMLPSSLLLHRLKQAQVILKIAAELDEFLQDVEKALLNQPGFTMDIPLVKERLRELQASITPRASLCK